MKPLLPLLPVLASLAAPTWADGVDYAQTSLSLGTRADDYIGRAAADLVASQGNMLYGIHLDARQSKALTDGGEAKIALGYRLSDSLLVGAGLSHETFGTASTWGALIVNYDTPTLGLGVSYAKDLGGSATLTALGVEATVSAALTLTGYGERKTSGDIDSFASLTYDAGPLKAALGVEAFASGANRVIATGSYDIASQWTLVGGLAAHNDTTDYTVATVGVDFAVATGTQLRLTASKDTHPAGGTGFGASFKWEMGDKHPLVMTRALAQRDRMRALAWGAY